MNNNQQNFNQNSKEVFQKVYEAIQTTPLETYVKSFANSGDDRLKFLANKMAINMTFNEVSKMFPSDIGKVASMFRQKLEEKHLIDNSYIVDMDKIISMCGYSVVAKNLSNDISGEINYRDSTLAINANMKFNRNYFTKVHEFKHILYDNDGTTNIDRRSDVGDNSSTNDTKEIEANQFASCFLMPEYKLKEYGQKNLTTNLGKISNDFGVSKIDMAIRLRQLSLSYFVTDNIKEYIDNYKKNKSV